MKNYKSKFDFNRPFKLVHNRPAFDQILTTDHLFYTHTAEQSQPHTSGKTQIAVPNIQIIERITSRKSFARITPNYIRCSSALTLPKENHYELTEIDLCYLNSHNKNLFVLADENILTEDFFRNCIIELERKASQLTKFPLTAKWIKDYIDRQYAELLNLYNLEALANSIYNYWRNRREQLKFPLYRLYWRDDPYQADNLKPFKRRVIPKRNLRKFAEIDEVEIIEELLSQFNNSILICDRIQARQNLKLKNIQLKIISFHEECNQYFKTSEEWKEQFLVQPINRQKDKEKLKTFKHEIQIFKSNKSKNYQEVNMVNRSNMPIDKNLSLTNFLASVIYEAEQLGINYETIFQNHEKIDQPSIAYSFKNENSVESNELYKKSTASEYMQVPLQEEVEDLNEKTIEISIQKCRDLIIRSFELEEDQQHHTSIADTLLDYRRKRLAQFYYGDDDDIGQYKDLRKNINSSFRKFLQLKNHYTFISSK